MPSQCPLEDELGDIIQKARVGKGLSIEQVARATALEPEALRQIERYAYTPERKPLGQLAAALDLHAEKLGRIAQGSWRPRPIPPELAQKVISIDGSIGGYAVHGYLLYDSGTGKAACIDTGCDPQRMLTSLASYGLRLTHILLTHCHQDHMGGVDTLQQKTAAGLHLHRGELALFSRNCSLTPDDYLDDGAVISVGPFQILAISTPGHTPGGMSFFTPGICFVGDALFAGSTGRSMSPQGYRALLEGLRQKVLSLPDDTVILPGHGPPTTVGEEKAHNPFF